MGDPSAHRQPKPRPARSLFGEWFAQSWVGEAARRVGAAAGFAVIGVCLAAAVLAYPPARETASNIGASFYRALENRPEFRLRVVEIHGVQRLTKDEVMGALSLKRGALSSFSFDAQAARRRIEKLGWVKTARVTLRSPQKLEIEIRERTPAMLWRVQGGLRLLDPSGQEIARPKLRNEWPALPLIVGAGADVLVNEATDLYAMARRARLPIVGLVRIGERRWDMELVDAPRVMLPEQGADVAMDRFARWAERKDLISERIEFVDLRIPHAPTLRLAPQKEAQPPTNEIASAPQEGVRNGG